MTARIATARTEKVFSLAAPSWVFPGTIRDNCFFLEKKVKEVGLLFLETASCLAYGRHDLPPELSELDLSFHVHLPSDLPWQRGGGAVAAICLELMDKVAFLRAARAVLHPPPAGMHGDGGGEALAAFGAAWVAAGRRLEDVLLENTRENDLTGLQRLILPGGGRFGLCPDLGHIIAYGQRNLLAVLAGLPVAARPRMAHVSAPGSGLAGGHPRGAHRPLDALDADGLALGAELLSLLAEDAVIVVEIFDWGYIERSLPILERWGRERRQGDVRSQVPGKREARRYIP